MSGEVTFDEEEKEAEMTRFVVRPLSPPRGLYRMLIDAGLAKDNKGANRWLAVIAIGAVLVGFFYPVFFG